MEWITVPWVGSCYTNTTAAYYESEVALNSLKKPYPVIGKLLDVTCSWLVYLVKSVKIIRGCRVRFVPRWKRGRWRSRS